MKTTSTFLLAALALIGTALVAPAQDDNNRRRDFNSDEFRQRMNERLKSSLKVSDEEWGVIQPLIEKVQTKQRESMSGRIGRRGGDRGGDNASRSDRPGAAESEALRTALENESTSPDELKSKLNAVREQRKKAQAELAAAREELRKVLSVRQEAALVAMGVLE